MWVAIAISPTAPTRHARGTTSQASWTWWNTPTRRWACTHGSARSVNDRANWASNASTSSGMRPSAARSSMGLSEQRHGSSATLSSGAPAIQDTVRSVLRRTFRAPSPAPSGSRLLPQHHSGGRGEKARTSRLLLERHVRRSRPRHSGRYGDVRTLAIFARIAADIRALRVLQSEIYFWAARARTHPTVTTTPTEKMAAATTWAA